MEDLTNQKFGKLTALKPVGKYKREFIWLCRCDCGNETDVRISKLKNGYTKSCSCIKKPPEIMRGAEHPAWSGHGDISMSVFSRMKATAAIRGWEWQISIEYIWDLYLKQGRRCAISNREMSMPKVTRSIENKTNDNLASLDRIDGTKGYIDGNVQWVCKRINYMKHVMSEKTFLEFVKDIYENKIKII